METPQGAHRPRGPADAAGEPSPGAGCLARSHHVSARFARSEETFFVEELPAYEPAGEGTHLYLRIRKRGLSTPEALRQIARALGQRPRDVGYAGLKDRRATTTQTISLEHVDPEAALALRLPGLEILSVRQHRNKLRRGHLRGNRFRLRFCDPTPGDEERAREVLDRLATDGLPHRFGPQRFGSVRQLTAPLGFALLAGDAESVLARLLGETSDREAEHVQEARAAYRRGDLRAALCDLPSACVAEQAALRALLRGASPARAVRAIPRSLRQLYVSAAQSAVFNALLEARLAAGPLGVLLRGDVAFLHGSGAAFRVEDPLREQPRADRFEISPAGPLFGRKLLAAADEVAEDERAAFERFGVPTGPTPSGGERLVSPPPGARRPYRVPLGEPRTELLPDGLWVEFTLPRGAYATVVASELKGHPVD